MKILLDIDGVMIKLKSWQKLELLEDNFPDFENKAVESLNKILNATNASIILTTSHRFNFSINEWKEIFKNRGIETNIQILDKELKNRKEEILYWLETNDENYIIIDDDKILNSLSDTTKERLLLTSSLIGLTNDISEKAIKILTGN